MFNFLGTIVQEVLVTRIEKTIRVIITDLVTVQ